MQRSIDAIMADERQEHDAKMKKMEAEMEQVFDSEMKVKENKQKLNDSEAEVCALFVCMPSHKMLLGGI